MSPIPVIVVCGFLGAGKTTLLRRVLADPQGVRYGVLVNDFGAIGIDGALLADTGADRVTLDNGCICCSIQDDLAQALDALLDRDPPPERVIVETSGVSRPLPVGDTIASDRFRGRAQLDGIYCLIDAAGFGDLDYADTELAIDQAVGADLVVLNKTDLASPAQIAAVETTLRAAMPKLRLLPTRQAELPRDLLFDLGDTRQHAAPAAHHHGHDHDHDHEFAAWHWTSPHDLDAAKLRQAVRTLPAGILRAKGLLRTDQGGLEFHLVGKRTAFQPIAAPAESAVVAIGRTGNIDPAALTALFDACVS